MDFITHSKILAKPDIKFGSFCEFQVFREKCDFLDDSSTSSSQSRPWNFVGSDILTISLQFQSKLRSPEKKSTDVFPS